MQSSAMKRFIGTLVGVLSSLGAVILWMLLGMFGFVAGYVGALMGLLFLFPYKKINRDDKSLYPYIFAAVLIVVEVAGAEMLTILLYAVLTGISFVDAFYLDMTFFFIDIGLGLLFSFLVYGIYVPKFRRRDKQGTVTYTQNTYYNPYNYNPYNDPFSDINNNQSAPPNNGDPNDPFGDDPFNHNNHNNHNDK